MEKAFEKSFTYTSPSHGDWGIVRVAALVPESYLLFVCPFACGRHGAIGAIQQGFKDKLSYLYVTQEDVIEGYDNTIAEAVDELFIRLKRKPKAMFIYVSCLDDLIGTDLEALVKQLHKNHPETVFRCGHMNPISLDTKEPPGLTTQDAMYGFIEGNGELEKDSVNLVGVLERLDEECELYYVLKSFGIKTIRQLTDYTTFEGLQEMGKSGYNLMISPIATLACKNLQKNIGMPFAPAFVSYDTDVIQAEYARLAEIFKSEVPDLSEQIALTKSDIEKTLDMVGDTPFIISCTATIKPFSMARALIKYGFSVKTVVAGELLPIDKFAYEFCKEKGVEVVSATKPDAIFFKNIDKEVLAVGFDAAYVAQSDNVVNVSSDLGMYGYYGVRRLMSAIRYACENKQNLYQLIEEHGVII